MCSSPVTLGGGSAIAYGGPSPPPAKTPASSQRSNSRGSWAAGSYRASITASYPAVRRASRQPRLSGFLVELRRRVQRLTALCDQRGIEVLLDRLAGDDALVDVLA